MLTKTRLWLHRVLIRLIDLLHPGYLTAECTVGRVQRMHDLLTETKSRPQAQAVDAPAGPVDTSSFADKAKQGKQSADDLRTKIAAENRLTELADIVLELKPGQSAHDVPARVLNRALAHFIRSYAKHMTTLSGTRASIQDQAA